VPRPHQQDHPGTCASADRGTSFEAGPPQPRRRWRVGGEIQSAGYARRRRPLCGCGRGFDSHRLHWFRMNRQSRTYLQIPLISSGICCDKRDIVCRRFRGNAGSRNSALRGVAAQLGASDEHTRVRAPAQGEVAAGRDATSVDARRLDEHLACGAPIGERRRRLPIQRRSARLAGAQRSSHPAGGASRGRVVLLVA
jgi:hypothetical protein